MAVCGEVPVFIAVKEGIFPVPDAANPTIVLVFVHVYVVPVPVKLTVEVDVPLHIT